MFNFFVNNFFVNNCIAALDEQPKLLYSIISIINRSKTRKVFISNDESAISSRYSSISCSFPMDYVVSERVLDRFQSYNPGTCFDIFAYSLYLRTLAAT